MDPCRLDLGGECLEPWKGPAPLVSGCGLTEHPQPGSRWRNAWQAAGVDCSVHQRTRSPGQRLHGTRPPPTQTVIGLTLGDYETKQRLQFGIHAVLHCLYRFPTQEGVFWRIANRTRGECKNAQKRVDRVSQTNVRLVDGHVTWSEGTVAGGREMIERKVTDLEAMKIGIGNGHMFSRHGESSPLGHCKRKLRMMLMCELIVNSPPRPSSMQSNLIPDVCKTLRHRG